jgi:Arc/MetJ-type ribon-helix-helix transcriptional regulator
MNDTSDLVSVHLTQQQIELLERLKERGDFGAEYSEVILTCFRKYVEQFLGKGRFGNVGSA